MDYYGITAKGNITAEDQADFIIINDEDSGTITLKAKDSGSVERILVKCDPDGPVDLYYDGAKAVYTSADGLRASVTDFNIQNDQNSGTVSLKANDSAGTPRILVKGDPDGPVELYYDAIKIFETAPYGINADVLTDFIIINNIDAGTITLRAKDTGAVTRTLIKGDPDGRVELWYDGAVKVWTGPDGLRADRAGISYHNEFHGGLVALTAENSTGGIEKLIEGDPDGALDLYYDGAKVAETTANGITGAVWG